MTIEEKAKEYASKECPIIISGAMQTLTIDEWSELAERDYLAGYNEAMRWRDPINDPPKCNDLMQIKYGDIFSNIINYGHDRYLEDMGMWDIEQLANIKVLAWRPIK